MVCFAVFPVERFLLRTLFTGRDGVDAANEADDGGGFRFWFGARDGADAARAVEAFLARAGRLG